MPAVEPQELPAASSVAVSVGNVPLDVIDARLPRLNDQGECNRIHVFEFDPDGAANAFGAGAARIVDVRLVDEVGVERKLFTGGEVTGLVIEAEVRESMLAPIFGFYVKDRLGQRLFGDNTYLTFRDMPLQSSPGSRLRASFCFRMPILPNGEYSIDVALASGSQDDHTQQHWIHDALAFRASESTMRHGLVGIPMHTIKIEPIEPLS
jgi:lipopolysaccharide transport system ATP-binding protein